MTTPRLPCRHCTEPADEHTPGGKCLFASTMYMPVEPCDFYRWWCAKYDHYYAQSLQHGVHFVDGRTWAWEVPAAAENLDRTPSWHDVGPAPKDSYVVGKDN